MKWNRIIGLAIGSWILGLNYLCIAVEPSEAKLKTLYNSLDPRSISQHFAFYELYHQYPLGQQSLKDAWQLLTGSSDNEEFLSQNIPTSISLIESLVQMVNKPIDQELTLLDEETLQTLQKLSNRLAHVSLKGHHIWNEQDMLSLPHEEIDLARGLFLSQFPDERSRIQSYETLIDLMALQILARLPKNSTPEEKIRTISAFIFDEMGFRFPPHSLYAKDIDIYTFLPSVLDSRRGVCLGVSILYLCLAQRLELPLEMITPPGHIYIRYREKDKVINIETTARGIHIDSDEYLSINTRALQQRNMKEVIGMAHFNQASVYWQNGDYEKALESYRKAAPYMKEDPLLKELTGYLLLLTEHQEEGEQLLDSIKDLIPTHEITKNTMIEDYFQGRVDAKGIGTIFTRVDEDRQSILNKKRALEETLERCPNFRAGILSVAITWLQLHRLGEALDVLKRYLQLDTKDPEAHYYLSILYGMRHDYLKSWDHLKQAEAIVKAHQHHPKSLKELRQQLLQYCPE